MPPRRLPNALSRLAAAEERFLASDFLAPVVRGGGVRVRIVGVVSQVAITPWGFEGWGVFRPTSCSSAQLVRAGTLAERQRYLQLFPQLRLILCGRDGDTWLAMPAHQGDTRFRINSLVAVRLITEAALFDQLVARFDGARFWYDSVDDQCPAGSGEYLRKALEALTEPRALDRPGLTAEQRSAYALQYAPRQQAALAAARDPHEERLRRALGAAGADFVSFREHGDVYTVSYDLDGQQRVAAVAKSDLTVQAAGICLSGQDANFDLQSLVGVLREYQDSV